MIILSPTMDTSFLPTRVSSRWTMEKHKIPSLYHVLLPRQVINIKQQERGEIEKNGGRTFLHFHIFLKKYKKYFSLPTRERTLSLVVPVLALLRSSPSLLSLNAGTVGHRLQQAGPPLGEEKL